MEAEPVIELRSVTSSKIAALGYDEAEFVLYVLFPPSKLHANGSLYAYNDIAPEMYEEILAAESIGKFFGARLQYNADHPHSMLSLDHSIRLDGEAFPSEQETPQQGTLLVMPTATQIAETDMPERADELRQMAAAARDAIRSLTSQGILRGIVVISNPEEFELVDRKALELASLRKSALAKIEPKVREKHQVWKDAVAQRNAIEEPFIEAIRMLDQGLAEYRRQERARAAEAQRTADEYAKRAAQEAAEARSKELARSQAAVLSARGDTAAAVAVLEHPMPAAVILPHVAPVLAPQIPKTEGVSVSQDWDFTIEEPRLVPCTPEFWSIDETKIRSYVKRVKEHAQIPGVRVFAREVTRRRAR